MIGLKIVLACGTLRGLSVLKLQVEQMTGDYWAGMNESVNRATEIVINKWTIHKK